MIDPVHILGEIGWDDVGNLVLIVIVASLAALAKLVEWLRNKALEKAEEHKQRRREAEGRQVYRTQSLEQRGQDRQRAYAQDGERPFGRQRRQYGQTRDEIFPPRPEPQSKPEPVAVPPPPPEKPQEATLAAINQEIVKTRVRLGKLQRLAARHGGKPAAPAGRAAPVTAVTRAGEIELDLTDPQQARMAIIAKEILSPPKSLRPMDGPGAM